jgi:hypothetical protein
MEISMASGKPDMAQGGTKELEQLDAAMEAVFLVP